jgi:uncharacterized protein YjaZ
LTSEILNRFSKKLEEIIYPIQFEGWHIQGRIKNKSNQVFKFDVRNMEKYENEQFQKKAFTGSKADKMVFELSDQWVIVDIEELHNYVKETNNKDINLNIILKEFQWNLIIQK